MNVIYTISQMHTAHICKFKITSKDICNSKYTIYFTTAIRVCGFIAKCILEFALSYSVM